MQSSRLSVGVILLLVTSLILDHNSRAGVLALSNVNPSNGSSSNKNNNNKPKKSKAVLKVQDTKINTSKKSLKFAKPFGGGGGGRKSITADMPNLKDDETDDEAEPRRWQPTPPKPSEARLTVVQVTDVYTLVRKLIVLLHLMLTLRFEGITRMIPFVFCIFKLSYLSTYLVSNFNYTGKLCQSQDHVAGNTRKDFGIQS